MKTIFFLCLAFTALATASLIPDNFVCEWTGTGFHCYFKPKGPVTTSVYTTTICQPTTSFSIDNYTPGVHPSNLSCGGGYNGPACVYMGTTYTTDVSGTPTTITTTNRPTTYTYVSTACEPTTVTTTRPL